MRQVIYLESMLQVPVFAKVENSQLHAFSHAFLYFQYCPVYQLIDSNFYSLIQLCFLIIFVLVHHYACPSINNDYLTPHSDLVSTIST